MTHCDDPNIEDLLAPFALGACPDDEADLVREHLHDCATCRDTLAELSIGRDALLTDVPERAPSAALKAQVMDRVHADAELFGAATPRRTPAPVPSRFAWLRRPLPLLATAAAMLVAVVIGVSQLGGGDGAPGSRTVPAQVDTAQAPRGSAHLVVDGGRARLVVAGLPDPGRGRVYEVWLRTAGGTPRPTSALFSVDRTGAGETAVPGDISGVDQVLVTSEPSGGSTSPSRVPLVVATV